LLTLAAPVLAIHLGEVLAEAFDSLGDLMEAGREELMEIHEIGPIVADSIVTFFSRKENRDVLRKLKEAGVNLALKEKREKSEAFAGKTFVVTGTLGAFSRNEAESTIKRLGGKVASSVSKKTDFVVVGEDFGGTKYNTARKLGIQILSEGAFLKMIKNKKQ